MDKIEFKRLPTTTLEKIAQETHEEAKKLREQLTGCDVRMGAVLGDIGANVHVKIGQKRKVTQAFIDAQPTAGLRAHWQELKGIVYKVTEFEWKDNAAVAVIMSFETSVSYWAHVPINDLTTMEIVTD